MNTAGLSVARDSQAQPTPSGIRSAEHTVADAGGDDGGEEYDEEADYYDEEVDVNYE